MMISAEPRTSEATISTTEKLEKLIIYGIPVEGVVSISTQAKYFQIREIVPTENGLMYM